LHEAGGTRIELTLHEAVHHVHQRGVDAEAGESVRRLEAEQATADDDGARARPPHLTDRRHVLEIAKRDDARQVHAGLRQADRVGAGRQHEPVEGQEREAPHTDLTLLQVDTRRRISGDQPDSLLQVPALVAKPARLLIDLIGEKRGQQHAVVGGRRLGPDHRHVEALRTVRPQALQEAQTRHAIADDHEPLASHRVSPHAASAGARWRA
jgi:hypothetical protein